MGVRNHFVGVSIPPYIGDEIRLYMFTLIAIYTYGILFWFADDAACMVILFRLTHDVEYYFGLVCNDRCGTLVLKQALCSSHA